MYTIRHHSSSIYVMSSSTFLILVQSSNSPLYRCIHQLLPTYTVKSNSKMSTRPTCQSKWKSSINFPSLFASSKNKHVKILDVLKPRGREYLCHVVYSSTQLLVCCMHIMIQHSLHRIVPINHWKFNDFNFSIGQTWDLLRLLLNELNLINK